MEIYLRSAKVRSTPEQAALFGPAFDLAWPVIRRERGIMPGGSEERATKDRLARIVIDLVTRANMLTPTQIATAAVIALRDQARVVA